MYNCVNNTINNIVQFFSAKNSSLGLENMHFGCKKNPDFGALFMFLNPFKFGFQYWLIPVAAGVQKQNLY